MTMSVHSDSQQREPSRKRIRKGTKSCWECKRRKIRCQLSSEDVSICSGCLQRGTHCLSQEFPEEHDSPGPANVGERLGRVELLLEKLVSKISQYEEEEEAAKIATPESMGTNDVLTPYSATGLTNPIDNTPLLSFSNEVAASQIGRRDKTTQSQITNPQLTGTRTPSCRPVSKTERICQALIDLLPSQSDLNTISHESNSWLLIHALNQHSVWGFDITESGSFMSTTFNMSAVARLPRPAAIAKTLTYIAVCLQQLPAGFDASRLHLGSLDTCMDKYMSTVQSLITADDELVSSMDGLECLILMGIYHINAGNPRRAWLTFRRALNIGQLLGIDRPDTNIPGGRHIWYQIIQAERYLALLLGLPAGSTSSKNDFLPHENFKNPDINKDQLFNRKVSAISVRIIDRNSSGATHTFATTQEIDEQLEGLSKEMPPSWWAIPPYLSDIHTPEAALQFDRLLYQIWFFQLEAILHLPYMLRATTERRYEYSKFSCLKASREMMHRYLALRLAGNKSFCCKIVDFGALTSTMTLFLSLLDQPSPTDNNEHTKQQRESDRHLVQTVLTIMEELSAGDKRAAQSVGIIRTLLAADPSAGSPFIGNLRLSIPYFGTVNIVRAPPSSTTSGDLVSAQQTAQEQTSWQSVQFPEGSAVSAPVVSFTSSQFPSLVPELPISLQDWNLTDMDTVFFDSILGDDIDSNWMF